MLCIWSWSNNFDIFFSLCILLPGFLLEAGYSAYFSLYFDMRLSSFQDNFIFGKFIWWIYYLFLFKIVLRILVIFIWLESCWFTCSWNSYPSRFPWAYSEHTNIRLFYFDPLYLYDSIFSEFAKNYALYPYDGIHIIVI